MEKLLGNAFIRISIRDHSFGENWIELLSNNNNKPNKAAA